MIDWVHEACEHWSGEVLQRDYPTGFAPLSELDAYLYVHNPAGLTQDTQELSSAVYRMRTVPALLEAHNVLVAHYLFDGMAKAKARTLGMNMAEYWRHMQSGHCYLAARINQPMQQSA